MNEEALKVRKNDRNIHPLILGRWSPRAMSGELVSDDDLFALFEAARWAPSSYNNQPWRFLYGKKGTEAWPLFFDLLVDFNKQWVKNAAVLLLIASETFFSHNHKPSKSHSFDTGAAWMSLALEACHRGLVVHGMEGFDYEKARAVLQLPSSMQPEAMIAIGKPGKKEMLIGSLQEKEMPSTRRPISSFVFEGMFKQTNS